MALADVTEFITLTRASRRAELGKSKELGGTRDQIKVARQRFNAGQSLWDAGFRADGVRLTLEALEATLEAARAVAGEGAELEAALEALEVPKRARERVREALKAPPAPVLDEEIEEKHQVGYESASGAIRGVLNALGAVLRTPLQVKLMRVGRILGILVVLAVGGVFGYRWAFPPPHITVSASAERGHGSHPATFAYDDNPATEWLMEDRQRGYLEFELVPARNLAAIRLLNAHNPPFNDRATRNYRVELIGPSSEPIVIRGTFDELDPDPEWERVEIDQDDVSILRIHVDTFHGLGGGIADVELEERGE